MCDAKKRERWNTAQGTSLYTGLPKEAERAKAFAEALASEWAALEGFALFDECKFRPTSAQS